MNFSDIKISLCGQNDWMDICMKTKMNLNSYHSVNHLYLQCNINLNLKAETIQNSKKKLQDNIVMNLWKGKNVSAHKWIPKKKKKKKLNFIKIKTNLLKKICEKEIHR